MRHHRLELLLSLGLFVTTLVVFWPACAGQFLNYDDPDYVEDNAHVRSGLTKTNVLWALTTLHAANWHPLTWLSLQLDASLFGAGPWGFHFTNVLLHAVSSVLLFAALRLLTSSVWRSAVVVALFALHPLRVESVAWIAERKDVLSGLLCLLTLLAYAWYVRQPSLTRYALLVVAFALGLLAKPMLVTLPCVLLLLDYWPLRRVREGEAPAVVAGGSPAGNQEQASRLQLRQEPRPPEPGRRRVGAGWWPLVREKLPLFVLSTCSCLLTWYAQQHGEAVASLEVIPLPARLGNAVVAYGVYLCKTLWPSGLAVFYPHPAESQPLWQVAAAGLFLAVVSLLVLRAVRQLPYLAVGWLWYLGMLVPVIGLVQVGDQALADRYTYLPLIGIFVLAVWGVADLAGRWHWQRTAAGLAAVALLGCAVCTRAQLTTWHDSIALWTHALNVGQPSRIAHYNLGGAFQKEGHLNGAREHYLKAIQIDPDFVVAHNNLGTVLRRQKDLDGAIREYSTAVRLDPTFAKGHSNLGLALQMSANVDGALRHYNEALRLNPKLAEGHVNLGGLLETQGDQSGALREYTEALRLDPQLPQVHYNLGVLLAKQGRLSEAVRLFTEAVRLDPGFASGYLNLGLALGRLGQWNEATAALAQATRLQPNNARCHLNLAFALYNGGQRQAALAEYRQASRLEPAWLATANQMAWSLATNADPKSRNGPIAVELAQKVCQATGGQEASFLDTLAAAQAEVGQYAAAAAAAHAALALNPPAVVREPIETRLRLYEGRQPFREAAAGQESSHGNFQRD